MSEETVLVRADGGYDERPGYVRSKAKKPRHGVFAIPLGMWEEYVEASTRHEAILDKLDALEHASYLKP